ncbi:MAG: hypothetical protein ACRCUY_01125 [Thermoguttaceae bacterium]
MFRNILVLFLVIFGFFIGPFIGTSFFSASILVAQSPFALTKSEQMALLDKSQEALKWFSKIDLPNRQKVSSIEYRKQTHPLELMQSAAILQEQQEYDLSRRLREMFSYLQPTPEECFEIEERLGSEMLNSFLEQKEMLDSGASDSTNRVKQGATKWMNESLLPIERIVLIDPLESASDYMRVATRLIESGRPSLVRYYLRSFLEKETTPAEYARIAETIGAKRLMQLASDKRFAPRGQLVALKIFTEAKKHWTDTNRIDEAISDWTGFNEDGSVSSESLESLSVLWKGDRVSIVQLIAKLPTIENEKESDDLVAIILALGPEAKQALIACLQSDDEKLIVPVTRGLNAVLSPSEKFVFYPLAFAENSSLSDAVKAEIIQFAFPEKNITKSESKSSEKPSDLLNTSDFQKRKKDQAEKSALILVHLAQEYMDRNVPLQVDLDNDVSSWIWDENEKSPKPIRMNVPQTFRYFAELYAKQAHDIFPNNKELQRLRLFTLFDRVGHSNGRDEPFAQKYKQLESAVQNVQFSLLERIIEDGISTGHSKIEHSAAAQIAALILAEKWDAETLLKSNDGKPRTLVKATMAKDRRVRFAALEAIMKLIKSESPDFSYIGSSFVKDTLIWFAKSDGLGRVVSAHPKETQALLTAGLFNQFEYKGDAVTKSREAMQLAAASPDVEMVIIDQLCSHPPVDIFVQEMRSDPRTAEIPIAVLDDSVLDLPINQKSRHAIEKSERIQYDAPFVTSLSQKYPRIQTDTAARVLRENLFQTTGFDPVPTNIRLEQANKSLEWIRDILATNQKSNKIGQFDELESVLLDAFLSDARMVSAMKAAAFVPTATMQNALFQIVANSLFSMELRENAASSLESNFDSFGILLRGKQVQQIYDRYNLSESEPEVSQKMLSHIIDVVEEKTNSKQ